MDKKENNWLSRRLEELGKSKRQLAITLDVNPTRINELEKGMWKLQTSHIRKAAEFLEFDRTALLDFVSGDITEEELWNSGKQIQITDEDLALLKAVKSIATRPQTPEAAPHPAEPSALPTTREQSR